METKMRGPLLLLIIGSFVATCSSQTNRNQTDDAQVNDNLSDDDFNSTSIDATSDITNSSGNQDDAAGITKDVEEQRRIKLEILLKNTKVQLDLQQNMDFPTSIPVYLAHDQYSLSYLTNMTSIYPYQDPDKHASFVKWKTSTKSHVMGIFEEGGKTFTVEPLQGTTTFSSDTVGSFDDDDDATTVEIDGEKFKVKAATDDDPTKEDIVILSNGRTSSTRKDDDSSNASDKKPVKDNKRKKRAFRNYEVELFIIIDYAIYRKWERKSKYFYYRDRENDAVHNIRFYFAHVLNGINARFRTIKESDMQITIRPVGMLIAKSPRASFWTEYNSESGEYVEGYAALDSLQNWINSPENKLPKFDQISLFTGYALYNGYISYGERRTFGGIADIPGACDFKRASISVDRGMFSSIQTGAHELAHSLGAFHDGYDNNCRSDEQYIMSVSPGAVTLSTNVNRLRFSWCSIQDIRDEMRRLNNKGQNCLLTRSNYYTDRSHQSYLYQLPGQRYSVDEQCKFTFGSESYYCGGGHLDAGICLVMYCWDSTNRECFAHPEQTAADGTICGNRKWCMNGECKYDGRAPYTDSETCLYGDFRGPVKETNREFWCKYIEPYKCYKHINNQTCCDTCKKIRDLSRPTCEYGDRDPQYCRTIKARNCYDDSLRHKCCETCERLKVQDAQPNCEYGDKATFCSSIYDRQCYAEKSTCCETCKRRETGPPGCEYGDKVQWCNNFPAKACYQQGFREMCCSSCCRRKTGPAGCEWGDRSSSCSQRYCEDYRRRDECCYTCARSGDCEDEPSQRSWCAQRQDRECYSPYTARACCGTCRRRRRGDKCPYGDKYSWCDTRHCSTDARECCHTCPSQC